jgi:hypothetical protein
MKNPGARERAVRGAVSSMSRKSSGRGSQAPTNLTEASYRAFAWIAPPERTGAAVNFLPAPLAEGGELYYIRFCSH